MTQDGQVMEEECWKGCSSGNGGCNVLGGRKKGLGSSGRCHQTDKFLLWELSNVHLRKREDQKQPSKDNEKEVTDRGGDGFEAGDSPGLGVVL